MWASSLIANMCRGFREHAAHQPNLAHHKTMLWKTSYWNKMKKHLRGESVALPSLHRLDLRAVPQTRFTLGLSRTSGLKKNFLLLFPMLLLCFHQLDKGQSSVQRGACKAAHLLRIVGNPDVKTNSNTAQLWQDTNTCLTAYRGNTKSESPWMWFSWDGCVF